MTSSVGTQRRSPGTPRRPAPAGAASSSVVTPTRSPRPRDGAGPAPRTGASTPGYSGYDDELGARALLLGVLRSSSGTSSTASASAVEPDRDRPFAGVVEEAGEVGDVLGVVGEDGVEARLLGQRGAHAVLQRGRRTSAGRRWSRTDVVGVELVSGHGSAGCGRRCRRSTAGSPRARAARIARDGNSVSHQALDHRARLLGLVEDARPRTSWSGRPGRGRPARPRTAPRGRRSRTTETTITGVTAGNDVPAR